MPDNKPSRILYFVQLPPPVHGVSMLNQYITTSQVLNKGFDTRILRIHFSNSIEELRRKSLLKIFSGLKLLVKLALMMKTFKPDLVYFSVMPVGIGFLRDFIYIFILKMYDAKLIFHLNNRGVPHYYRKWIWRKMYQYAFGNVSVIHVSPNLLRSEIDILRLKNTFTYVVANTTSDFKIRKKLNHPDFPVVLFISNLFQEKGLQVLLESLLKVRKTIPGVRLKIYGASRGKWEDRLYREFVSHHGMSDYVEFNGPVYNHNKIRAFESADIFVFPSYFEEECFPLSILEAMQAALPIIATRIGAIPEMIKDGEEGFLVDPLSPDQLSSRIIELISDRKLRDRLGENAYRRFTNNYNLTIFETNMRKIFFSVLKGENN